MMDYVFKMMDSVFKMMDSVFKMMDYVFKMVGQMRVCMLWHRCISNDEFVFKNDGFCRKK